MKADVFIDDRNLGGLPDWGTIYEMVCLSPREDRRSAAASMSA